MITIWLWKLTTFVLSISLRCVDLLIIIFHAFHLFLFPFLHRVINLYVMCCAIQCEKFFNFSSYSLLCSFFSVFGNVFSPLVFFFVDGLAAFDGFGFKTFRGLIILRQWNWNVILLCWEWLFISLVCCNYLDNLIWLKVEFSWLLILV